MNKAQQSTVLPQSRSLREAVGIFLLAIAIFLVLAVFSSLVAKENWMGAAGQHLSQILYGLLGAGLLTPVVGIVWAGVRFLRTDPSRVHWGKVACYAAMTWLCDILLHIGSVGSAKHRGFSGGFFDEKITTLPLGGILGEYSSEILRALLGTTGTVLLCVTGLAVAILFVSSATYQSMWSRTSQLFVWIKSKLVRKKEGKGGGSPVGGEPDSTAGVPSDSPPLEPDANKQEPDPLQKDGLSSQISPAKTQTKEPAKQPAPRAIEPDPIQHTEPAKVSPKDEPMVLPRFVLTEQKKEGLAIQEGYEKTSKNDYQLPSLDLLDFKEQRQAELDRKAMLDLAQKLERSLLDYQVKGRVTQIHPGPVVTMYEFAPSPGTKLSKITALASDLAMALEALRVRIVAPIPGKAAVGIEVPNGERETVFLKEILADEGFAQARSKITIALGKDISGLPVSVDLSKMPHLLIAGTTGSGKSVAVNVMICSILFRASPDEVKLIMIDPKMLELSIYEGIPHLLLPVVTDPKKANLALKWAVDEMDRRYEVMSKTGVRDIGSYNRYVDEQTVRPSTTGYPADPRLGESDDRGLYDSQAVQPDHSVVSEGEPLRKFPYIVVIIDEFADLMMVAAKEVEISVARIAQKARAAGIHLILATQRPSVDVITGLIKANFPSRIAFQVASRIDSRTILDTQGAETLLGMGDMLFTDRGQALKRVHGALITDAEVHRMVEHLKSQGRPIYDMAILAPREEEGEDEGVADEFEDEMYDQAVRIVSESRQASISMVQRRLRIGYNRAARMIERMEREGIVSTPDGAKGREVLVQNL